MPLPDAIHIVILTTMPLRSKRTLGLLLDAFEGINDMSPTNWGPDERARNPYNREEMIAEVTAMEDFSSPGLRRARPPRYQGYFWANNSGLKTVKVEFGSGLRQKDLPIIFQLGDAIAEALKPEYGLVHMIWRKEDSVGTYSATSVLTAEKFQDCGPKPPTARTWFGPHLVKLIGRKRLDALDVPVKKTAWGGVELDLVADPWEADFNILSSKQKEVLEQLKESGVFGDYTDWHDCKPGPRWKPVAVKDGD